MAARGPPRIDACTACSLTCIVRLPFSIFVGACAVVLVMFMPNTREPGATSASRQERLAATISICVVVGYISTLFEPICIDLAVFVANEVQRSLLKEWWPEPKPAPPPPPPSWCPWTCQAVHQFPGRFFIDAWEDRCLKDEVDWHVKVKIANMMERWIESLALGYITACILFHVPFFVFREHIANSYAKVTVNDKGKMCLGIVAWACLLSVLPAVS